MGHYLTTPAFEGKARLRMNFKGVGGLRYS